MHDRPLALQRKTDPALDQLNGVLLRSGHELESISSRQDIILASEPPPNPGRLAGPSALRLNRGIDNDLRTIGFLIAAHYSIPVDRSCRTRRGRAALMPECGHWARSSSPRAPRAAHPPRNLVALCVSCDGRRSAAERRSWRRYLPRSNCSEALLARQAHESLQTAHTRTASSPNHPGSADGPHTRAHSLDAYNRAYPSPWSSAARPAHL